MKLSAALMVLLLAVAGCATTRARWSAPPTPTAAPAPTPSAVPSVPSTDDPATDAVSECFDGDCTITVSEPTVIRLHPRFRIAQLEITRIGDGTVTMEAAFLSGGGGVTTGSAGTTLTLNDLVIQIISVDGGSAVLDFTP